MSASPSSSPRLPSPPPIAEDQLGPKSPLAAAPNEQGRLGASSFDEGASRRIRPGTKAADMPEGPALVPLKNIETAFQLTEHLKALYNAAIRPDDSDTVKPIDRATATRIAQPPDGVDKSMWLYELCRFLCQRVNSIIIALFRDHPPCSKDTCTEMRASEWQYLCAVHDPPKPCCAIDYCCHTLDWASNTLTSPKNFPSRLSLGTENGSNNSQMRQLTNIFRRVYRIFAHAWFQHRDVFWDVESKGGLYVFFKTVCDVYNLIPAENYTVLPEAEGIEFPVATRQNQPTILKNSTTEREAPPNETRDQPASSAGLSQPTTHATQRHRQSPSADIGAISTVPEEPEEDNEKTVKQEEVPIAVDETIKHEGQVFTPESSPDVSSEEEMPVEADKDTTEEPTEDGKLEEPEETLLTREETITVASGDGAASEVVKEKQKAELEDVEMGPESLVDPTEPKVDVKDETIEKPAEPLLEKAKREVESRAGEEGENIANTATGEEAEMPLETEPIEAPESLALTEHQSTVTSTHPPNTSTDSLEDEPQPPKEMEEKETPTITSLPAVSTGDLSEAEHLQSTEKSTTTGHPEHPTPALSEPELETKMEKEELRKPIED